MHILIDCLNKFLPQYEDNILNLRCLGWETLLKDLKERSFQELSYLSCLWNQGRISRLIDHDDLQNIVNFYKHKSHVSEKCIISF